MEEVTKRPLNVRIMVTEKCNLKCKHCYVSSGEKNTEMEFDLVKRIVDEIYEIGGERSTVALMGGETLLYSKLIEAIEYVKEKRIRCVVVTNGYLTKEDMVRKLTNAGLDTVSISVDGPPEFHDFIRGRKGSYASVINTIRLFKKYPIRMNISVPVFKETINFFEFFQKLGEEFKAPLRFSRFVEVGRGKNLSDGMLDKEGYKKLLEFCIKNNHMLQDPFFTMRNKRNRTGCTCGVNVLYIITDGTTWPCWRMQIPLGNVKDQSLSKILMNPLIKDYQNREKLKGSCGRCRYKYNCGGCRAVPYVLYGDYHGEDPQCPIID